MPGSTTGLNAEIGHGNSSACNKKAVVIGIYGIPGSGKTFLLNQLKQELGEKEFAFYEGSQNIADLVPGGLDAFEKLDEQEKLHWRELAIQTIRKECMTTGLVAVVAGHSMLWSTEEEAGQSVWTQSDQDIYTHVVYLDIPNEIISQRRMGDISKSRPFLPLNQLSKWQQTEKSQLCDLCYKHGILFSLVSQQQTLAKILTRLRDFQHHNENYNLSLAESMLDKHVVAAQGQLGTILVMDADRTLAPDDTGMLFWDRILHSERAEAEPQPLKKLFSSSMGYSYTAFRQATLLYEDAADDPEFDAICEDVASVVVMHREFVSLLHMVTKEEHVGAVIVTCGLRCVWEKVLEKEGLSETVKVIGGGRIADSFVVTAAVKEALVRRLQVNHRLYVWAFGDSPLDLDMLCRADQAIVVVGDEKTRSKTMDLDLFNVIRDGGLRARQVVLPSNSPPRQDTNMLPLIRLTDQEFVDAIFRRRSPQAGIQVQHATYRSAAKILMTPMRNANIAGPALRESHRRVGQYLGTEFLSQIVGLEEYAIPHVQGHSTSGYRLLNEQQTTIVALMRGGEPMAIGVNDVFPLAMFIHAKYPEDIKLHHLQGQMTVVLVDSVVNNGKTVVQFEQHVRKLHATIRIVVIAGVIQEESVSEGGLIYGLARNTKLNLIALRLSQNKFTGSGTTDTGNRLFNTTHMP
ncbi:uracil phosphoribosyltransferase-domain-containing protein [Bisporella sp. PMI_857]|nr:uracil phosphoribosyltransferase-domain-containing protein [Bisporella sp. PMI_857]